jgi:hypothetical protein
MNCGALPKRLRSTLASGELANGEQVGYCGQADSD